MVLVPGDSAFKMHLMQPIRGAANLGTIILWPLATVVQFGVGRYVTSNLSAPDS
jgi:Cu+-exporting ATPase